MIRRFLEYASHQTVDDLQAFTSQWVPVPTWIKTQEVIIPTSSIDRGVEAITAQLGSEGIKDVGGVKWWQWRDGEPDLKAEWIEMRDQYHERIKIGDGKGKRVMLYVHGGAYFFGSVDEHRYQMQRHARKLRARVFAPRYRLSPQFPFPCGLLDCLSAYLYLLKVHEPTEIVLAGDSAGGGMVLSMLCILRDQGLPMPAGAILISPWVDLTHSFPSVAGSGDRDYIPEHGFMQKPSASWPPPNADELELIAKGVAGKTAGDKVSNLFSSEKHQKAQEEALQGFAIKTSQDGSSMNEKTQPMPTRGANLSIELDGKVVEIKDQIQMYAPNHLLADPLVSPVMQTTLGGLPPLLILTGGGEMLRDEQIYVAHKAADPHAYPPGPAHRTADTDALLQKYKPTNVQLQVWDDLCHVPPTLSFTRPAKYMYRSIAQFGAWALARAQKTEIDILDDDDISFISTNSDTDDSDDEKEKDQASKSIPQINVPTSEVGKAGDPLPPFKAHMIRQRVDRHGRIYPLAPAADLAACQMNPADVGCIKPGPVRKWMAAKKEWDTKYAGTKRSVQKQRIKEMVMGYESFGDGETPPPSALAGRRRKGMEDIKKKRGTRNWGLAMWSGWSGKHDKRTLKREEEAVGDLEVTKSFGLDQNEEFPVVEGETGTRPRGLSADGPSRRGSKGSKTRSRTTTVTDEGQTEDAYHGTHGIDAIATSAQLVDFRREDAQADEEQRVAEEEQSSLGVKPLQHKLVEQLKGGGGHNKNASTSAVVAADGVIAPIDVLAAHPAFSTGLPSPSSVTSDHYSAGLMSPDAVSVADDPRADKNASTTALVDVASIAGRRSEDAMSRYDAVSMRSASVAPSTSRPILLSGLDRTVSRDGDATTMYSQSRLDGMSVMSSSRPVTPSSTVAIFHGRERTFSGARANSPDSKTSRMAIRHAEGVMPQDNDDNPKDETTDGFSTRRQSFAGSSIHTTTANTINTRGETPIAADPEAVVAQSQFLVVETKPEMYRNVSTDAVMHAEGVISPEAEVGEKEDRTADEKGLIATATAAVTAAAATVGLTTILSNDDEKTSNGEEITATNGNGINGHHDDIKAGAEEVPDEQEVETPAAATIDEPEIAAGKVYAAGTKRPEMPERFETAMEML